MAQPLLARDQEIGDVLGMVLAGVDVIGDCVTEIHVTSPTCFQEIFEQTGFEVAAMFIDALEAAQMLR